MPVFALTEELAFPFPELADPSGLLAVGGDLSPERLLLAYQYGIFPWFNPDEPFLWWSPDPRLVLFPEKLKVKKSMRPILNQGRFRITYDRAFGQVIRACKTTPREGQDGTWITPDMVEAYEELHRLGFAHSVEAWQGEELVGGLYGISLGDCYFGESMFAHVSNASKAAFITLVRDLQEDGIGLIDCQTPTEHLMSLGAEKMKRKPFLDLLENSVEAPTRRGDWGERYDRG